MIALLTALVLALIVYWAEGYGALPYRSREAARRARRKKR